MGIVKVGTKHIIQKSLDEKIQLKFSHVSRPENANEEQNISKSNAIIHKRTQHQDHLGICSRKADLMKHFKINLNIFQ